jgi:hypothetical protein
MNQCHSASRTRELGRAVASRFSHSDWLRCGHNASGEGGVKRVVMRMLFSTSRRERPYSMYACSRSENRESEGVGSDFAAVRADKLAFM